MYIAFLFLFFFYNSNYVIFTVNIIMGKIPHFRNLRKENNSEIPAVFAVMVDALIKKN